mgnify:FL=1
MMIIMARKLDMKMIAKEIRSVWQNTVERDFKRKHSKVEKRCYIVVLQSSLKSFVGQLLFNSEVASAVMLSY